MKKIARLDKMNLFRQVSRHFNFGFADVFLIVAGLILFFFLATSAYIPQQEMDEMEKIFLYNEVEETPEFPGGDEAMMKYIRKELRYPVSHIHPSPQGRVVCSFIINEDGSISDETVLRGVYEDLDKEALRVIREMPAWIPGKEKGKEVKVKYVIPILFRLN